MGDKSYLKSFSREEYLTHVGKLQRRMEEEGLDLLLLSSPENIYYATGYRSCTFAITQIVIAIIY